MVKYVVWDLKGICWRPRYGSTLFPGPGDAPGVQVSVLGVSGIIGQDDLRLNMCSGTSKASAGGFGLALPCSLVQGMLPGYRFLSLVCLES